MFHHLEAATLLRQRAAEIDRMVLDHHRRGQGSRRRVTRSAAARILAFLRSA